MNISQDAQRSFWPTATLTPSTSKGIARGIATSIALSIALYELGKNGTAAREGDPRGAAAVGAREGLWQRRHGRRADEVGRL